MIIFALCFKYTNLKNNIKFKIEMRLNNILLLFLIATLLTACDNQEERIKHLVTDYLKSNEIAVEKYEIKQSTVSPAKQTALNDSSIWSLATKWMLQIQLTDMAAKQQYANPSLQENMVNAGIIEANEYVDSINHRINQLDTTKMLGCVFVQSGQIIMKNNEIHNIKLRIVTDRDISKILLCTPLVDESERIMKIIEDAQHGDLTKLPIDPQKEMMYYLSTGKQKPNFQ